MGLKIYQDHEEEREQGRNYGERNFGGKSIVE